jgi:hypothetical protein
MIKMMEKKMRKRKTRNKGSGGDVIDSENMVTVVMLMI